MTDAAQKIAERVPLPETPIYMLAVDGVHAHFADGSGAPAEQMVESVCIYRPGAKCDVTRLYTAAQMEALRLAVAEEALRGAEAVVAPNVSEALAYSRNYATANPLLSKTAAEHILGLCDLLEKHASAPPAGSVEAPAHVGEMDRTAPPEVWLQIDTEGDSEDRSEAIPRESWDHISWYYESMGGQEVRYIRADLVGTPPAPAVDEAMVERAASAFIVHNAGRAYVLHSAMRAALTAALHGDEA